MLNNAQTLNNLHTLIMSYFCKDTCIISYILNYCFCIFVLKIQKHFFSKKNKTIFSKKK